jgi:cell division protease FtsH
MTDDEKKLTAYHEAGHALIGLNTPQSDPLHKVTIIPRGRALGLTMSLPERDKYGSTFTELTSRIAMMFGGRVAEELIFGKENITTGASSDIQQATGLARRMVTEFGMSDKLGRVRYSANEQEIFLGHSVAQQKNISEATAELIDEEVRRLTDDGERTARCILTEQIENLHKIAKALLEFETLSGDEVRALLRGETIVRNEEKLPPSATASGKQGSVPSSTPVDHLSGPLTPTTQSARMRED